MSLTITEATKGNQADHGNYFWDLQLSDGRKAWGLFKFDIEVGEEVVVAYEKDGKVRVKRPEKDENAGPSQSGSGGRSQPASGGDDRNASMALSYAKDLAVAGQIDVTEIEDHARRFLAFIETGFEVVGTPPPAIPTGAAEGTPEGSLSGNGGEPSGALLLKQRCEQLGVSGDIVRAKLKEIGVERLSELDAQGLIDFDQWLSAEADASIPF